MKHKILSFLTAFAMVASILVAPFSKVNATNGNEPFTVPTGNVDAKDLSETKPDVTEINLYKLTTKESYKAGAPWEHTGGKISPDDQTTNKYESLGKGVEGLKGAKFTFYKINVKVVKGTTKTDGTEADTQAEADKLNEKYFNILKANPAKFETAEAMNKIKTDGYTDAGEVKIPKGVIELAEGTGLTNGQTTATDDNGLATLKLADGYYWAVESQVPEKVTSKLAVPFGLTLPITNVKDVGDKKAGTHYLTKLYIYPKNIQTDNVQIDKDHANYDESTGKWYDKDGNEVPSSKLGIKYDQYQRNKETISKQLGQNAPYQSSTVLPRNYTFDSFTWIDTMSEGLTYNKDLVVTMDYTDADGQAKTNQPFINAGNKATFVTERDNGYEIKVTKDKVKATLVEYLKKGPVTFHFKYSAKVNNSAAVDKPQSNSITFIPKEPKGVPDVKSDEGKIEIKKSWKKKGQDATPAAKDLTYYVEDQNGKTVASVTVSKDDPNGKVYQAANGITFTVGANFGSGTFAGLPKGEKFKIREAVDGYLPTYEVPSAVPGSDAQAPAGKLDITNEDNPDVKKPKEPNVQFHGKKFVKMDQMGKETRLFGAVFAIRNKSKDANNKDKDKFLVVKANNQKIAEVQAVKDAKKKLDEKIDEYNKLTAKDQAAKKSDYDTAIDGLQKAYNDAVIAERTEYTWEAGTGNNPPESAYKLVSDGQGRFEITGLYAGDYELVELTAPVGYAKLDKPVPFVVKDGTYKGDSTKEIQYNKENKDGGYGKRVDNKKVTIPQTGGIGSIIFVIAGLMIMGLAAYKMKANKEQA